MQKLFTPVGNVVGYILGSALIGGKQFRLVSVEHGEIKNLLAKGKIASLDYEFPDEATHATFQQYLRDNKGDVHKAASTYLADLSVGKSKDPVDVAAETVNKPEESAPKQATPKSSTSKKVTEKTDEKVAENKSE